MQNLIQKTDFFKVDFYICPAHIPFHFAVHPWVVITENGSTSRYEVIYRKHKGKERDGYLYKNFYSSVNQGIKKSPFHSAFWQGKIIGSVSGISGSLAHQIVRFIQENNAKYPFKDTYRLLGPNSNTYIAWVLSKFPEANIRLPWNALGKNYITRK